MTRKQRTEILVHSKTDVLEVIAEKIEQEHPVEMIEPANSGLVMVKMRENAKKNLFYLGEVLVTECKVSIKGVMGFGILKGADTRKAYLMAVIDAAYNAKIHLLSELDQMLVVAKYRVEEEEAEKEASILRTKVDFETLDEEVKS